MSDMVPEVLNAALDSLFTPKEPGEQEYQGVDGLLYCRNSPDLDPKRPVFMRFFGLSSLSKPIGKPTKSRNFWCSLTQPECSIHNAA